MRCAQNWPLHGQGYRVWPHTGGAAVQEPSACELGQHETLDDSCGTWLNDVDTTLCELLASFLEQDCFQVVRPEEHVCARQRHAGFQSGLCGWQRVGRSRVVGRW